MKALCRAVVVLSLLFASALSAGVIEKEVRFSVDDLSLTESYSTALITRPKMDKGGREGINEDAPYVLNELLVKFGEKTDEERIAEISSIIGAEVIKVFSLIQVHHLRIGSGITVKEAISRLNQNPDVIYAEPNYIVNIATTPNDPDLSQLWGLHNTGQTGGTVDADIDAMEAWSVARGDATIVIGVIDTGVDYNHPDLAANIWTNPNEIPGDGIDNDNNDYIDDVYGWDWVNDDNDPMDDHGHGTHCAGTIAAVGNNAIGVVGVNWHASIMSLKFISADGFGSTADAISAIEYATMMGAHVLSNSWGGGGRSTSLKAAIEASHAAGILFVAAAGNDGRDNDVTPFYPASYDVPNVIAVAATDHNDALAEFSNFGATSVHLGAPGVGIYSTLPNNSYGPASGTSMACPHVAGVAGMILAHVPGITHIEVKNYIMHGVDSISGLTGKVVTGGRLNAWNSIQLTNAYVSYSIPFQDGFETGVDKWVLSGTGNWAVYAGIGQYGTGGAHDGDSVMVMTCHSTGTYSYSYADIYLKLAGESDVKLDYYWRTYSLVAANNEHIWLDIYDGTWHLGVDSLTGDDTGWQNVVIDLSGYSMIDGFIVRFRSYMNWTEDWDAAYLDMVRVYSTAPSVPVLISPDSGMVMNHNIPTFIWHRSTGEMGGISYYTLQYTNNPSFTSVDSINTVDTVVTSPIALSDTIYYWRVQSIDSADNKSDWSSVRSFEIDTQSPDVPTLVSPTNGIYINNSTVGFEWSEVTKFGKNAPLAASVRYILQVDTTLAFSNPVAVETVATTYDTVNLSDQDYYWRVRAYDLAGNQGSFASPDSFGVDITAPSIPQLALPDSGIITNYSTITFTWYSSTDNLSGMDYYILQYADNPAFTGAVQIDTVDTTYTRVLPDTTYYWRVRAVDVATNQSSWSDVWDFEIDTQAPDVPTLVSPVDGEHLDTLSVVFEWNEVAKGKVIDDQLSVIGNQGKVIGDQLSVIGNQMTNDKCQMTQKASRVYYILQVDTVPGFTSPIIDTTSLTSDTLILNQGLHYWRVRAFDMAGNEGGFSDSSLFVIDTTSPVIDSTTELPDTVGFFGPFTVRTKLIDNFSIKDVVLYFRINNGEWVADTMAGSGNWYEGEIPEQTPADTIIVDYYVTASDSAENLSRGPEVSDYSFSLFLTGIEEMRDIPDRFVLFAPRPNPSAGMVELKYGLPERADIGISIYDIQGRLVHLVYRGKRDAGYHKLKIDSRELSSGIYFIRFQTPCSTHIEKLIILR